MLHHLHPFVISRYENRIQSQNGEDGVIDYLCSKIPHRRYAVEIGATIDDRGLLECNTAFLQRNGWGGIIYDAEMPTWACDSDYMICSKTTITPDSFSSLLDVHGVPDDLGLLSIDVDGNDYWLWKSLNPKYAPAIVIIEYNAHEPNHERRIVPYKDNATWNGTDYFGANAVAMRNLGYQKGYWLVYICHHLNMFFVRSDLLDKDFQAIKDGVNIDYGPIFRHPTYQGERIYVTD